MTIFDDWPDSDTNKSFKHYSTDRELRHSAKAGCSMCAQFLKAGKSYPAHPSEDYDIRLDFEKRFSHADASGKAYLRNIHSERNGVTINITHAIPLCSEAEYLNRDDMAPLFASRTLEAYRWDGADKS